LRGIELLEKINNTISIGMLSAFSGLNGYSGGPLMDLRETDHVLFAHHHLFASPGSYHHCDTKQYAFGFQVFHLEFSAIYYSLDFLFLSHWWSNCGGFDPTKAGEESP